MENLLVLVLSFLLNVAMQSNALLWLKWLMVELTFWWTLSEILQRLADHLEFKCAIDRIQETMSQVGMELLDIVKKIFSSFRL